MSFPVLLTGCLANPPRRHIQRNTKASGAVRMCVRLFVPLQVFLKLVWLRQPRKHSSFVPRTLSSTQLPGMAALHCAALKGTSALLDGSSRVSGEKIPSIKNSLFVNLFLVILAAVTLRSLLLVEGRAPERL